MTEEPPVSSFHAPLQLAKRVRPGMLAYTILLGLAALLSHFYGNKDSTIQYPLAYKIWEEFISVVLLFAGNLFYSFGYITPLLRKAWKFVFPILILHFVVSGILHFANNTRPVGPAIAVLTSIAMLVLFFPTFRAHFLLGYGDVARVATIHRPPIVSEDPLRDLLAEIKRLRRTTQTAWVLTIALLSVFALGVFFQVRFEKPQGDSWAKVRTLAEASKYDDALALAKKLIVKDPDNPYMQANLGNLNLAAGNLHQAEACFTRAFELLPNESNAQMLNAVRRRIDEQQPSEPTIP